MKPELGNDYSKKVYDNLKYFMGDNMQSSYEDFVFKLQNEKGYNKKVYDNLSHYMGDGMKSTHDQFLQQLNIQPNDTNQAVPEPGKSVVAAAVNQLGKQANQAPSKIGGEAKEDANVVLPQRNYDLIYKPDMLEAVKENVAPMVSDKLAMDKKKHENEDANIAFGLNQNKKLFKELEDEIRAKFTPEQIENGEYEQYFMDEFKKRSGWVDPNILENENYAAIREFKRQIKSPGEQLRQKRQKKEVAEAFDEVLEQDPVIFERKKTGLENFIDNKVKDIWGEDAIMDVKNHYKDVTFGESLFLNPEVFSPEDYVSEDFVEAAGENMWQLENYMVDLYLDKVADKKSQQIWDNAKNTVGMGMLDPFVNKDNQIKYYRQTMDSKVKKHIAPWEQEIYDKISEYEGLLTKKEKANTPFSKNEMARFIELSNEIQAYQSSPDKQVFDPYTGEYKAKNDPALSPQAGDWAKEVDAYRERYGKFGMARMREELDKETLKYEELERINNKYNSDGFEDETGARLTNDMKESYQKIQALSSMLIDNYDPAKDHSTKDGFIKGFVKGFADQFGVEVETDYDIGKRNSDYLTEAGRPFNNEIQTYYTPNQTAQWGEEMGGSTGAGFKIGAELFIGNKLKGILGIGKFIERAAGGSKFKKAMYEHAFDANMYGLAYEAAGESYATGVGEYGGENLAALLGGKLKLNKGGIVETILKIGGGAAAEIPAELGGELLDRLVSGEGVENSISRTLGLDTKDGMSGKLSKVFWHSIALSGGGNLTGYAMNRMNNLISKKKDGTISPEESEELAYAQENYTEEWLQENTKLLLNNDAKVSKYNEIKDKAIESLTDDEKLLKGDVEAVLKHGDQKVISETKFGKQMEAEPKAAEVVEEATPKVEGEVVEEVPVEGQKNYQDISVEDLEKRLEKIEDSKDPKDKEEFKEIEKELESREWKSVMGSPLEDINSVVSDLEQKNKEMPNGFGSFIEPSDARQTKGVAKKYSGEVSKQEALNDFKDAFFGNPTKWYADGLKLRESARAFIEQGGTFKDLLSSVQQEFESDSFTEQEAAQVIKAKLDEVTKVNTDAVQDIGIVVGEPKFKIPSFNDQKVLRIGEAILDIGQKDENGRWSIIELFVPENQRRKGIASELINKAKELIGENDFVAQVSNDGSIDLHYKLGFRAFNEKGKELSLLETKQRREKNSSVMMRYIQPIKTEKDAVQERKTEEIPMGEQAGVSPVVEQQGEVAEEKGSYKKSQKPDEGKKKITAEERSQNKITAFQDKIRKRVADAKGIALGKKSKGLKPEPPSETKNVKIQSGEIGNKEVLADYNVTPTNTKQGIKVEKLDENGNYVPVSNKELNEEKLTFEGQEMTLGEYLKQDMERQAQVDMEAYEQGSLEFDAEVEQETRKVVTDQMVDAADRVAHLREKRMRSPLRGVNTGVLSEAMDSAIDVYNQTGDINQAYDAAYERISQSGGKTKRSSFDNWMTKQLDTEYSTLTPGEKMAMALQYGSRRLRSMVSSKQLSEATKLQEGETIGNKKKVVADFLNSKEIAKINKAIEDIQRLQDKGFSRAEIEARIDQVVDNAVKRKLIDKAKRESAIKDVAKDEKNKWKGINTIRWQKFNTILGAILADPSKKIFDNKYYFVGNDYQKTDEDVKEGSVDPVKEGMITTAQANYLIRLQNELQAIDRAEPGMTMDEFYTNVVALEQFRKDELAGKKSADDVVKMNNRERLMSAIQGVYTRTKEQTKMISDLTKSKNQTDAYEVLENQIEKLESIYPNLKDSGYVQVDQIDVYSTLIDYYSIGAQFAPTKKLQEQYKQKAQSLIDNYEKNFEVDQLKLDIKDNPKDAELKADLGVIQRLKGEIVARNQNLNSINKVMDVKEGKSFEVWKNKFRDAIKEKSSIVTASEQKTLTQVDVRNAERIGAKAIKKAQKKLKVKLTKAGLKNTLAKGVQISVNIQTLIDLLNVNKSKAYAETFTKLFSVVDKAENKVYNRAVKMNERLIKDLGLKNLKALDEKLKELNDDDNKVRKKGSKGDIILSQLEMATLYNWINDSENDIKMQKTATQYGFKGDVKAFKDWVTNETFDDAKVIAESMKEHLKEYREDLKKYYEEKLGVPYTFKDDYFPRKIHQDLNTLDMQKFDATELGFYNLNPTQVNTLHRRQTTDSLATNPQDIYRYMERYNKDLTYYLETYDALNNATRILNHDDFVKAVKDRVGEVGYNVLKDSMKSVIMPPQIEGAWYAGAVRNYAISRLMFNTSSAIKQAASVSGYLTQGVWVDKLADKKLMGDYERFRQEDETRQRRYDDAGGMNEETGAIQDMNIGYDKAWRDKMSNKSRKLGAALSKMADKGVTNFGERIMYGRAVAEAMKQQYEGEFTDHISLKDAYALVYGSGAIKDKDGNVIMSEQKANEFRENAKYAGYRATVEYTESSQQSSSSFFKLPVNAVNPGTLKQMLSFYKTSPVQQFSLEVSHAVKMLRAMKDPELTPLERRKIMAKHFGSAMIYHSVIPVAFQYIANGLPGVLTEWDEEDWDDLVMAAAFGNLNSLFILGDVVEVAKNYARGKSYGKEYAPIGMKIINEGFKAWNAQLEDYDKKLIATALATDKDSQVDMFDFYTKSTVEAINNYRIGGGVSILLGAMGINIDNLLKIGEAYYQEENKKMIDEIRGEQEGDIWIGSLKSFLTSIAATSSYHRNKAVKPESVKKMEELIGVEMPVLNAYKFGPIEFKIDRTNKHIQQRILTETNDMMDEWLNKEGLGQLQKLVDNINNDEEQKALIEFQKVVSELPNDFGLKTGLQRKAMSMRKDVKLQNIMKQVYAIVQRDRALNYYKITNMEEDNKILKDLYNSTTGN